MAKYTLEIQSRQIQPGPLETSVSELLEAVLDCEWSDDSDPENNFTILLESDRLRLSELIEIDSDKDATTNVTAGNQYKTRNNISAYPRCGFYGSYFKYTIQKKMPGDGNFKLFGVQLSVLPTNIDAEFFTSAGAIDNAWE